VLAIVLSWFRSYGASGFGYNFAINMPPRWDYYAFNNYFNPCQGEVVGFRSKLPVSLAASQI